MGERPGLVQRWRRPVIFYVFFYDGRILTLAKAYRAQEETKPVISINFLSR
jgi:hypothetical protein